MDFPLQSKKHFRQRPTSFPDHHLKALPNVGVMNLKLGQDYAMRLCNERSRSYRRISHNDSKLSEDCHVKAAHIDLQPLGLRKRLQPRPVQAFITKILLLQHWAHKDESSE